MKPICAICLRFFRMKQMGVCFTEGMPKNGSRRPKAGKAEPENWQPYKVWFGDLWECPDCGAHIISGVGLRPLSERHHEDFHSIIQDSEMQINDC